MRKAITFMLAAVIVSFAVYSIYNERITKTEQREIPVYLSKTTPLSEDEKSYLETLQTTLYDAVNSKPADEVVPILYIDPECSFEKITELLNCLGYTGLNRMLVPISDKKIYLNFACPCTHVSPFLVVTIPETGVYTIDNETISSSELPEYLSQQYAKDNTYWLMIREIDKKVTFKDLTYLLETADKCGFKTFELY